MFIFIIHFIDILLSGLLSGIMVCIWQRADYKTTSEISNLEIQKANMKTFDDKIPFLGLMTALLSIVSAVLQNDILIIFIPLLIATILLIVSGIITMYGNQPINKQIQRWTKDFIPGKWEFIRDRWLSFHIYRSILTLIAFILIVFADLIK
ncbi:MAG TPA: DUF1772 domain-containing protein [Puia sp.]|jgi:hypothetical protein|nr:DUF1772 domain-containing protein [Puia sp.]